MSGGETGYEFVSFVNNVPDHSPEAFAAVPLASTLLLVDKDREKAETLRKKTNINGSAIAIGHPNTSSGARLIMNLMYELKRRGGGYALGVVVGRTKQ